MLYAGILIFVVISLIVWVHQQGEEKKSGGLVPFEALQQTSIGKIKHPGESRLPAETKERKKNRRNKTRRIRMHKENEECVEQEGAEKLRNTRRSMKNAGKDSGMPEAKSTKSRYPLDPEAVDRLFEEIETSTDREDGEFDEEVSESPENVAIPRALKVDGSIDRAAGSEDSRIARKPEKSTGQEGPRAATEPEAENSRIEREKSPSVLLPIVEKNSQANDTRNERQKKEFAIGSPSAETDRIDRVFYGLSGGAWEHESKRNQGAEESSRLHSPPTEIPDGCSLTPSVLHDINQMLAYLDQGQPPASPAEPTRRRVFSDWQKISDNVPEPRYSTTPTDSMYPMDPAPGASEQQPILKEFEKLLADLRKIPGSASQGASSTKPGLVDESRDRDDKPNSIDLWRKLLGM